MASIREKIRDLFYFIGKIAAPSEKPHTFNTRQPESQSSSATLSDFFSFVIAFRTLFRAFLKFIFSSSVSTLYLSCQTIWILMFSSFEKFFKI